MDHHSWGPIEYGTTLCTEDMCTEIEIDVSYMKK